MWRIIVLNDVVNINKKVNYLGYKSKPTLCFHLLTYEDSDWPKIGPKHSESLLSLKINRRFVLGHHALILSMIDHLLKSINILSMIIESSLTKINDH